MRRVPEVDAGELAAPVPRMSGPAKRVSFVDFYRSELPGLVA